MSISIAALIAVSVSLQTSPPKSESVWFWFATCGGPTMTIEVNVQGTAIQKIAVPLCRGMRDTAISQGQSAGRVDFSFRPLRPIVWRGYREAEDHTQTGQVVEGSLWQAGAEVDTILVGVSFMTADRIVMNTIHTAHPDRRDESAIAPGVVVITYPTPSPVGRM